MLLNSENILLPLTFNFKFHQGTIFQNHSKQYLSDYFQYNHNNFHEHFSFQFNQFKDYFNGYNGCFIHFKDFDLKYFPKSKAFFRCLLSKEKAITKIENKFSKLTPLKIF
jgi:hypothetical protein